MNASPPTPPRGMPAAPALLTVPEFAASLRISRRHAADLVATRKVASIQIGRCRRIPASELTRVLREGV